VAGSHGSVVWLRKRGRADVGCEYRWRGRCEPSEWEANAHARPCVDVDIDDAAQQNKLRTQSSL
jgi:hypothetical protein